MRERIFFFVFSSIWALFHISLGWRWIAPMDIKPTAKVIGYLLLALSYGYSLWTLVGPRMLREGSPEPTLGVWVGYGLIGLILTLWPMVMLRDLGWGLWRWLGANSDTVNQQRRWVLGSMGGGVVGLGSLGMTLMGAMIARGKPKVERVQIPLDREFSALDGLTIAQISDIHIGPTLRKDFMRTIVDSVNSLKPHIIAVTGDLIDGHVSDLKDHVAPLAELQAPLGVYFVTGNHEYYWDGEAWTAFIRDDLKLDTLINEHRPFQFNGKNAIIAGVTDVEAGAMVASHASSPKKAAQNAPNDAFKILLAHQPRSLTAAQAAGFHLQLSGHTHGGQFFPWSILIHLVQPVSRGLKRFDKLWVYVNRGTGYWGPPHRFGSTSEISLLRLTANS